jgi:hypothetical protein
VGVSVMGGASIIKTCIVPDPLRLRCAAVSIR